MSVDSGGADLWLRRFHPSPTAGTTLVCLPHSGGSAAYFFPVSKVLSPGIDVVSVQYPGRQERRSEPRLDTVAALADAIAAQLSDPARGFADRDLALFGHSLGATVAFEVALRLEAAGVEVSALFASGRRAPSTHRDDRVHLRDDAGLLEEVRSLGGSNELIFADQEILDMVLPALRSDYKAAETYRYVSGPQLSCAVHALVGKQDPQVTPAEAEAWATRTRGRFELHWFPGGHFYLNSCVPQVLEVIRRSLGSAVGLA
jgi:surfactin synthase thioesterase subunit